MGRVDAFTIITGLASLFSFIIQIFDLFPRLGRARQFIPSFLVGVFLGSLLRAIDPSSVRLNVEMTGFTLFAGLFTLVVLALLIAATISSDPKKRSELFGATAGGLAALLFVLGFGFMLTSDRDRSLTVGELRLLTEDAKKAKDVDRAVRHLQEIQSKLRDEEARKRVQEEIRALELQAGR